MSACVTWHVEQVESGTKCGHSAGRIASTSLHMCAPAVVEGKHGGSGSMACMQQHTGVSSHRPVEIADGRLCDFEPILKHLALQMHSGNCTRHEGLAGIILRVLAGAAGEGLQRLRA